MIAQIVAVFVATAYCLGGTTATGARVGPDVVAADPAVIALGSTIYVDGVAKRALDTGGDIRGRRIDVWMADCAQAARFGRPNVRVEVRFGRRGFDRTHVASATARDRTRKTAFDRSARGRL